MIEATIENLLRQKIGLNAAAIGSNTIARAVRSRMASCGLVDMAAYLTQLHTSGTELAALIETVVVPETWFFRDREPFVLLAHYVMSEWLPSHPNQVFRILSAPCSTGEEPYSMAIALLEAGLGAEQFQVDAVDISQKALQKAQLAVYDEYSFRGKAAIGREEALNQGGEKNSFLKEKYFQRVVAGYSLNESVRKTVNFIQGNVLDSNLFWDQPPYDVVFCRNLLIYLDQPARQQTIHRLDRLLVRNGLFFVGHSEMGQLPPSRFSPIRHALAFAFRKVESGTQDKAPVVTAYNQQGQKRNASPAQASRNTTSTRKAIELQPTNVPSIEAKPTLVNARSTAVSASQKASLTAAKTLADGGQLVEAVAACEAYLNQNRNNAEAYCLLGQLYQAVDQETEAEQCFRKAVYLQPHHEEALLHLILLKEQSGDLASALVLRQRLQRIHLSEY
ncbi:protein-glutamate O-methyltransferase CheR [Trichocoleus sp. FACHB-262]|uniref:CheR family methyltransferase n=1 Tax=Trichocoleus sp. FACHB-262 TaxID=2692869 RepID=UPI0016897D20|nr:protein-glutamate O-methyltransferase CheR [Trichocoleus sp. FACHB-262]MBD2121689.1 chemotaxis protein [Trichocoleus sp. FACHB-262]